MKMFLLCVLMSTAHAVSMHQQTVQERSSLLAKTWNGMMFTSSAATTPITRAVNLLKEMGTTLQKDMDEDERLYKELSCWCTKNSGEKKDAIKSNTDKVAQLQGTIEANTALSANLKEKIKETEAAVEDDKNGLATATALRMKELAAFNSGEKESVAAIANLKSAIVVLSKHHGAALPQLSATSFIQSGSRNDEPWAFETKAQRDLEVFTSDDSAQQVDDKRYESKFLQQAMPVEPKEEEVKLEDHWTRREVEAVQVALHSASSFVQSTGSSTYVPAYSSQSGEIFGVLRTLKEEMEADLADSQKTETKRAGDFAGLRAAGTARIDGGSSSAERKEDELAKNDNALAEAKEDLEQTQATLAEDTKFAENLAATCDTADTNFAARKTSRLAEMKAVADTVDILSADDAKDAAKGTFKAKSASFMQLKSQSHTERRHKVSQLLLASSDSAEMALLASSVQLDAFTKVKAMCNKMIESLTQQQADEVKKNDYCVSEFQSNDMATEKAKDRAADLDASATLLKQTMKTLQDEVAAATSSIKKEQASLQKATLGRKAENLEFQKNIADQTLTIQVLEKAMDRLATYYDQEALIQRNEALIQLANSIESDQTPPVAQMTYTKSAGSAGVLSLIEKLIYDAKEIMSESKKSEADSQKAYEELVADSNGTIKALGKQVLSKTAAKVDAHKDLTQTNLDLKATNKENDRLGKTDKDLHDECDFVMKNFMLRQKARGDEVEAIKQALMILSGAAASA